MSCLKENKTTTCKVLLVLNIRIKYTSTVHKQSVYFILISMIMKSHIYSDKLVQQNELAAISQGPVNLMYLKYNLRQSRLQSCLQLVQ